MVSIWLWTAVAHAAAEPNFIEAQTTVGDRVLSFLGLFVLGAVAVLSCHALGSQRALGWAPLLMTWLFFVALGVSQLGPLVDDIWKWIGLPHTLAYGWGTWLAWTLCVGALVGTLWVRFSTASLANIVYLAAVVPLLVASRFEDQLAKGSYKIAELRIEHLTEALDLNDEQQKRIEEIFAKLKNLPRPERKGSRGKWEDRRRMMRNQFQEVTEEIEAVLTPEQQEKFGELRMQRRRPFDGRPGPPPFKRPRRDKDNNR